MTDPNPFRRDLAIVLDHYDDRGSDNHALIDYLRSHLNIWDLAVKYRDENRARVAKENAVLREYRGRRRRRL